MFKLREYQSKAVGELHQGYELNEPTCVVSPTASGKTVIIRKFIEEYLERYKGKSVCISTHRLEILDNLKNTLEGLPVDFHTIQKLARDETLKYDSLIIDECVDGDTEVLTRNGWVPFKEYCGEDIAQWSENGTMQFVEPIRVIKNKHEVAHRMRVGNNRYVYMSPNHRQPYWNHYNELTVITAKRLNKAKTGKLVRAAYIENGDSQLSNLDRLNIMLTCWGHYRYLASGETAVKIECRADEKGNIKLARMTEILEQNGIKYKIRYQHSPSKNPVNHIVFHLEGYVEYVYFDERFNLGEMSYDRALGFMEELAYWKAKCYSNCGSFRLQNEFPRNVDFIQAVATMINWKSGVSKHPTCNTHVITISPNKHTGSIATIVNEGEVLWNDYLYCVEVPSSFFFIRKKNRIFVTGNCHHIPSESYRKVITTNCDWYAGFTATPIRGYMPEYPDFVPVTEDAWKYELSGLVTDELFKKFILTIDTAELIRQGFLTDYEFVHDYDFHIQHTGSKMLDYSKKEIDDAITPEECVAYVNKTIGNKKAIIFCHAIDFSEMVTKGLGKRAVLITSKTKKKERAKCFDDFKNGSIQILVNVDIFSEGVDVPAVDCVYMFRPTRSIPVFFQQIGRALRLAEGKTKAIVYDYVNNLKRLGTEPKKVKLKDMLLVGKFIKEECEVCGAYGIIEGKRNKTCKSLPNEAIRILTRFLSRYKDYYYMHYGINSSRVQFKLLEGISPPPMCLLEFMVTCEGVWYEIYNMPVILNSYNRWEIATPRNLSDAKKKKQTWCLKVKGDCKYSDRQHDYYIISDNLEIRETVRTAKIKA